MELHIQMWKKQTLMVAGITETLLTALEMNDKQGK
jgi:hypothetical protein